MNNYLSLKNKIFLVSPITWGSLFADDIEIQAKDKQDALNIFCKREGFVDYKIVYDSKRNLEYSGRYVVSIIEGHYQDESHRNMFVTGKRGYYKIIVKD